MAWIIKRGRGPLDVSLFWSYNWGWIWPQLDGWEKVYFYKSERTATTAKNKMPQSAKLVATVVEVTITVKEVTNYDKSS